MIDTIKEVPSVNPSDGLTPTSGLNFKIDQTLAITANNERRVIEVPIVSRNNLNIRYKSEVIVDEMTKSPMSSTTVLNNNEIILLINSEV